MVRVRLSWAFYCCTAFKAPEKVVSWVPHLHLHLKKKWRCSFITLCPPDTSRYRVFATQLWFLFDCEFWGRWFCLVWNVVRTVQPWVRNGFGSPLTGKWALDFLSGLVGALLLRFFRIHRCLCHSLDLFVASTFPWRLGIFPSVLPCLELCFCLKQELCKLYSQSFSSTQH